MRLRTVVVVLLVAACSAPPPTPTPAPPPALDQEDQAAWAIRTLDPCGLASPTPEVVRQISPRGCYVRAGAGQLAVGVGSLISHRARSRAIPATIGGLQTYRQYRTASTASTCELAIPLSHTRAIWLVALAADRSTVDQQCTAVTDAGKVIGQRLREQPTAASRTDVPPNSVLHWDMCDLRDKALGKPAADNRVRNGDFAAAANVDPDFCGTGGPYGLTLTIGSDPAVDPGQRVQLPTATAVAKTGPEDCSLVWAQERRPDGKSHLLTLTSPDKQCPTAEQAGKVIAALASPPPLPPPPARLGFTPDQHDEATDPVCRIVADLPEDCRASREVPVPPNTAEIMRTGGSDLACVLLKAAIKHVTGKEPIMAYSKTYCLGATPDRDFEFRLEINDIVPRTSFLDPPPPVTVAGFPAIDGGNQTSFVALRFSPYRDLDRPGNVGVFGALVDPPGSLDRPPTKDPGKLAVVNRIAEYMLSTYFKD